jgi:hypothetical protein
MGSWADFCLICGIGLSNCFDLKKYDWMEMLYFLNWSNKVIKDKTAKYDDCGTIIANNDEFCVTPMVWHQNESIKDRRVETYKDPKKYGYACHKACYNTIKQELGYEIKFSDVCHLATQSSLLDDRKKYGRMVIYSNQFFDAPDIVLEDMWIIESPAKNLTKRNAIIKIWRPLVEKFKKTLPRPSPSESATKFPSKYTLRGNDGNLYHVVIVGKDKIKRWAKAN